MSPSVLGRGLPGLIATLVTGVVLALSPAVALADPGSPPPNPSDQQIDQAQADQDAAATEVGRLSGLIATAESDMQRLQVEVENAASAYFVAQGDLERAQATAETTKQAAAQAGLAVDGANADLAAFARNSYIQGSTLNNGLVLLDSDGPAELIERAGLLESISSSQLDVVSRLELAQVQKANADSASRQAVIERAAAEQAANDALALAQSTLTSAQNQLGALQEQQAQLTVALQQAQERLLGVEGARALYEQYQQRKAAEEEAAARQAQEDARRAEEAQANSRAAAALAAAGSGSAATSQGAPSAPVHQAVAAASVAGEWVRPASGPITSCYCMRWGVMHWGIDFGAPMYAPIYAVGDGTVVRAGPATGFGQAIYVQHSNGDTTVYGHEEVIKVSTGQHVYAGQVIALVGMQGFSTGPHLHFEVHKGSIYGPPTDPGPWLAARGVVL